MKLRKKVPLAAISMLIITLMVPAKVTAQQMDAGEKSPPARLSAFGPFKDEGVPKDFHPKTDVVLDQNATDAVHVSAEARTEKAAPSLGTDGRVMYSYGAGLPAIVCAPLRLCVVELQAGEKIVGEPHIGDSVRWNMTPAMYGAGEGSTAAIVLKPQMPGLDTNLLITTDRRAYYLRLLSKPEDYTARVAFAYADETNQTKWQQDAAETHAAAKREQRNVNTTPGMIAAEQMNFDYSIHGGNQHLRPVRVFDDGEKTYIQMPKEIQHREAPALLIAGPDGKGETVNYRVKNQTYIVDRLFGRASLVLGSGKKAQRVEIDNGQKERQ